MPVPSKFKGYDRVLTHEPFKIGDLYYSCEYQWIDERTRIDAFSIVTPMYGPQVEGQTFGQRHYVNGENFTVIRKRTTQRGIPQRLALNRHFSKQLPLP